MKALRNAHPAKQLLFAATTILASFVIFQIISFVSGIFIFNIDFAELKYVMSDLSNPRNVFFIKWVQAVSSFGMFIFAAWLTAVTLDNDWRSFLGLKNTPSFFWLAASGLLMIVLLPFTNLLTSINNNLSLPQGWEFLEQYFRSKEDQMQQIMESLLDVEGIPGLLVNLVVIAVIPAVGEELIFRGVLQGRLTAWFRNHHFAILAASFLFAFFHFQFLSILPRFILGMVLGYIFYYTGSVWMSVVAHFFNNAIAVIFYYLYFNGKIDRSFETIGSGGNYMWLSVVSLVAGILIFTVIYRKGRGIFKSAGTVNQ